ncbi:nitrogenase component 1 [Acetivibrio straminisolvens]|jgi:nitrogenase molybdenum-iron protein alpha chain|uniref:Nitrogenase n=1 Tax=Acetivibrio straminisolvens JCM 21531 TaxID=1294263 RepID=W4V200_9FIRM|nr:nitrogenase component 1 [Acetivibrio straminisolvens]GAE86764.1 nitrogenase [Acetivibrio straminisolvens JCM 21531]
MENRVYNYLNEKAPPVREDRLKACSAFGGSCCVLSEGIRKGCLNGTRRQFSQTQGCTLVLSLAILNTVRNAVIVVHGPIGCGGGNIFFAGISKAFKQLRDPKADGLIWINTNLDEADSISGGETKLKDAILFAEKEFRPEAIIVVNSCVPAIIGDDVESVVRDLQKSVAAKIVTVHCEGFRSKIMATAYDSVYHGILRNLVVGNEKPQKDYIDDEERYRAELAKSKTVNLLNVSSMSYGDELELKRILEALGLKVRILPCYSTPKDFEEVHEAALNVSICSTHDDYFVGHLKEHYNIPYVLETIPIGIENTNKWVLDIAGHFGIREQAERLVERETKELNKALEPYKKAFAGKSVFLAGGEIRVLATAQLLQDLGLEVLGMKGYHFDEFGEKLISTVKNNDNLVFNIATGQPFEQSNLLNKLKPDVYVGHVGGNVWAAKQGFPIFPIFSQAVNYMGYSGAFEVARRLNRILKNNSFNKNISRYTRLPYYNSWYEEDPFKYIENHGG